MRKRNKKNRFYNVKLLVTVFVLFLLIIFLLRWLRSHSNNFVHYTAFGIEIPIDYPIHGIDVSRYQREIAWNGVKKMNVAGITMRFVFIKATEGCNLTDRYFKYNWRSARQKKIIRGAYHFFNPTEDAAEQAKYFCSQVKLTSGDLPPVLDAEQIGNLTTDIYKAKLKAWLDIVEAKYNVKPIIYTNAAFYKKYLGDDFDDYPLWIAHYYERKKPRISRDWTFWQHNDGGNVSGINAKVDFNVFNGDSLALQNFLLK